MLLAPEVLECVTQNHSFGEEERETGTFVEDVEQVKFLAQFAVVTAFSLFKAGDVLVKFRFLFKRGAVNTGQHLVVDVAAPICTCNAGKFVHLQFAGACHVGSAAKVYVVALRVQ